MAKSFAEELNKAMKKENIHRETELDRIHRNVARDPNHAYRNVEIHKPDPWRHGGGLTL